jgi:hypothetical protein
MNELSKLDHSALELLAESRRAVEQEINDRAQVLHERALAADRTLTLIGHIGQEAVGLYDDFVKRDVHFRGPGYEHKFAWFSFDDFDVTYSRPFLRRVRRYAQYIRDMHDDISEEESEDIALDEINRLDQQKRSNEQLKLFDPSQRLRMGTNYAYVSPPVYQVDPELIDSYQVGQQWRVNSNVPFRSGLELRVIHRLTHERGINRDTTVYTITSENEDGTDAFVSDGQNEVIESDLYLPIGLLQAARQAVRASVPRRISKKW